MFKKISLFKDILHSQIYLRAFKVLSNLLIFSDTNCNNFGFFLLYSYCYRYIKDVLRLNSHHRYSYYTLR